MAAAFGIGLIVPVRARIQYPKIAKFRQPMFRRRRKALETVLLAIPDRDLAGIEGFDNRLAIIILRQVAIPNALGENR